MRQNKFKYYFKDTNGTIYTKVFTLEEIEDGAVQRYYQKAYRDTGAQIEIVARAAWVGLKDKNEVEIYEGELLKWQDEILEARWGKGEFKIWSKLFHGFGHPDGGETGMINARGYFIDSEVIGNVWQHPELLTPNK